MAGMTLASIVSGNTVILKPSSDSPTIAAKFVELLEECGMPEGVVNFVFPLRTIWKRMSLTRVVSSTFKP